MKRIFENLLGVFFVITLILFTVVIIGPILFSAILLRFILPNSFGRRWINPFIVEIGLAWVGWFIWWMVHVNRIKFDIQHDIDFSMDQWNLIVSNHVSWVDIFALYYVTRRKIPMPKFFIKSQLIWVPIAGQAWWALDFPFMSRYSREYLAKHPEKAGKDIETTINACKKFSEQPTSVVNYLEGTRITPEKYARQNSPYKHLLKPKSGGIAFAIQALGEKFSTIIDTTVHYDNGDPGYWSLACGRVDNITMRLRKLDIPKQFLTMDYTNNPEHKAEFQAWVGELWQYKDDLLESLEQEKRNNM